MRIVADKNIVLVEQAFGQLGEVVTVEKDEITPRLVRQADILLVRSETRVGESLLSGSKVRFVGSPTSGFDHVDLAYLDGQNIGFSNAAGSNANSVAEYVLAAMLSYGELRGEVLAGKTLGVVGVGNIGTIVAKIGRALGMTVLLNDPPKSHRDGPSGLLPLHDLMSADFVTLHVPLTRTGTDPTYHLFNQERLYMLSPDTVLINTARGRVVDNRALRSALHKGRLRDAILDVWENEPAIDVKLLKQVALATPHIAGYSFDGKVKGTHMVFEAACKFLDIEPIWRPEFALPTMPDAGEWLNQQNQPDDISLLATVRSFYDVWEDDHNLRRICDSPDSERGLHFWKLRRKYRMRREFSGAIGIPGQTSR